MKRPLASVFVFPLTSCLSKYIYSLSQSPLLQCRAHERAAAQSSPELFGLNLRLNLAAGRRMDRQRRSRTRPSERALCSDEQSAVVPLHFAVSLILYRRGLCSLVSESSPCFNSSYVTWIRPSPSANNSLLSSNYDSHVHLNCTVAHVFLGCPRLPPPFTLPVSLPRLPRPSTLPRSLRWRSLPTRMGGVR